MRKFKKLGIGALALALGIGATGLTGCSPKEEMQIMNLSVNPGVEFVVDKDDKVLSVTASNEDGAYLLEKFTNFTGMSAKDAALKFIELSEEYGFVVSGTANGENITISVSGDGAQKLYNDVKNKISTKVTELGLSIGDMVQISEEKLESIVEQCYQEYSASEIEAMSQEKLMELIKTSREETKDIYTEHERFAYYKERAEKVLDAKIDTIKEYIQENQSSLNNLILTPLVAAMDAAHSAIETAYNAIDSQLETLYADIDTKMVSYIAEKEEYLAAVQDYRDALEANADANPANDFTTAQIEALKSEMATQKAAAEALYTTFNNVRQEAFEDLLDLVKTTIHNQMSALNAKINEVLDKISISAETLQAEIAAEIEDLKESYEANSSSPWTQQN